MLKKIFTNQQLSRFFEIAIIINIVGLLSDIIVYHYFSNYPILKSINKNISFLSISMICLIIISQSVFIFMKKHQEFITRYKLLALTIEICICTFFIWLLTIDNDIQEKSIIFFSGTSRTDHSTKIVLALIGIIIMLIFNFYHTLKKPDDVNESSVPEMIHATFRLVITKHLLIFISFLGIFHFEKIHKFSVGLVHHSISSLFFYLKILGIIIPSVWIAAILYYIYQRQLLKKK